MTRGVVRTLLRTVDFTFKTNDQAAFITVQRKHMARTATATSSICQGNQAVTNYRAIPPIGESDAFLPDITSMHGLRHIGTQ